MKTCSKCKLIKTLKEFTKNVSTRDGWSSLCSECSRTKCLEYHRRNWPEERKNMREGQRWCRCCKAVKEIFEFGNRSKNTDGIGNVCKLCIAEKTRRYRSKVKERNLGLPPVLRGRVCSMCGVFKGSEFFSRSYGVNGGLYNQCRECHKINSRKNYLKTPVSKRRESREKWKENNRESHTKQRSEYYYSNKESIQKYLKKYREDNPHKVRSYRNARRAEYRGSYVDTDILGLKGRCDWKCLRCGSRENLSIDHVIPIKTGGSNYPSNLQILCRICNSIKNAKIIDYRPWTMDSDGIGLNG